MSPHAHSRGPTCRLYSPKTNSDQRHSATPPRLRAQFFYTLALALDDPLSPVPPPTNSPNLTKFRRPPKPFSQADNAALEEAWNGVWYTKKESSKTRRHGGRSESATSEDRKQVSNETDGLSGKKKQDKKFWKAPFSETTSRSVGAHFGLENKDSGLSPILQEQPVQDSLKQKSSTRGKSSTELENPSGDQNPEISKTRDVREHIHHDIHGSSSPQNSSPHLQEPATTGTPFLRAPSRSRRSRSPMTQSEYGDQDLDYSNDGRQGRSRSRQSMRSLINHHVNRQSKSASSRSPSTTRPYGVCTVKPFINPVQVPVGISRLHLVNMPSLQIKPIYWSPLHDDIGTAWRATWFYKETMLPIEPDVANQLEAGYVELAPWTETWNDELNSASEVGAEGEEKVVHRIWPKENAKKPVDREESRPATASGGLDEEPDRCKRKKHLETCQDKISLAAEGVVELESGPKSEKLRRFPTSVVFYANEKEAYILRPNLAPSAYRSRKPIASIRKGKVIGIPIIRGFDWNLWEKSHPTKVLVSVVRTNDGASMSQSGTANVDQGEMCKVCAAEEKGSQATDLVLVVHGIGQKLSERVESFHFTHAINAFRRQVHEELGSDVVRNHLRNDLGGIMVLPVNWRSNLSFEDGGHHTAGADPDAENAYNLKDITPTTIPAVRSLVNEVMSDIPYYLSHHKPKMIEAVVKEANRIYRLWCNNNPEFQTTGRVHLIAHSLGSAMALDILSRQPTILPQNIDLKSKKLNGKTFEFDTKNLFFCGSPAGFFLLLNRGALIPRKGRNKIDADGDDLANGVAGEVGTYGCLAVDNLYNILSYNDPIAYQLNPIVDKDYASSLKPATVPSTTKTFFETLTGAFMSSSTPASYAKAPDQTERPNLARLGTTVEMDTHNFTREEIAEKKFGLLNDNLQVDFFLSSGGGPLEIQYLNMLSAHSSYWISRDFVRFLVVEIGRESGRQHTLPSMRAMKQLKK